MSFGHHEDCEEDQELEVRRAFAGRRSASRRQSSCSDDACSQSDISLCDDGASEEEGEHILGHLVSGRGNR